MPRKYTPKAQRKTPVGRLFGVRKKKTQILAKRTQDKKHKLGVRRAKHAFTPTKRQHWKPI